MKRERKNIATLKDIINISVQHKWNTASDKWASRALGGKAGRGHQESAFCVVTGEAGAPSKGKGQAQAPWGRMSSLFTYVHTHTCTHTYTQERRLRNPQLSGRVACEGMLPGRQGGQDLGSLFSDLCLDWHFPCVGGEPNMDTQGTNVTLDSGLGARGAGWRPPETWTGKKEGEKRRERPGGGGGVRRGNAASG